MSKKIIILIVAFGCLGIALFSYLGAKFSYQNKEVELRNLFIAQQETNKIIYDKVWKTISQRAQITSQYEKAFKEIYTKIMDARYAGNDQLLFKFVQEQNPTLSENMYKSLADDVEANRAEFADVQKRILDIKREHDNLRQKFPSSWWCSDKPELIAQIVTSTKTEKAFSTGKDDDVQLFK